MNVKWIILETLFVIHAVVSVTVSTKFSNLCSRVYFPHPSDDELPYLFLLSGVYVRTSYVSNDFPVYKSERSDIYFYRRSNYLIFSKDLNESPVTHYNGPRIEEYAGIGVNIISLSSLWTRTADNASLPFGSAIRTFHKWFFWIPKHSGTAYSESANYNIDDPIMPVCVNESVSECGYDRPLFFSANQTGLNNVLINNPNIDEFIRMPDIYRYNRPVYKHSNFAVSSWYLYYYKYIWLIGPDYDSDRAYWRVFDNSTKPELIIGKWQIYKSVLGWTEYPVSMMCRGENLKSTCLQHNPCVRGSCYINPIGETVCSCPWGWTGKSCELPSARCGYTLPGNIGYAELDAGTIVTPFCPDSYLPIYYVQQCQRFGLKYNWISLIGQCQKIATTKAPVTRSPWSPWSSWNAWNSWNRERVSSFNADDVRGLESGLIVLGLLVPLFLPLVHWCFVRCRNKGKKDTKKESASVTRIYSLHFYFGVFLWVAYLCLSIFLHLRNYGRSTFLALNIVAVVMIVLSYVAVLIESSCSNEKKYLTDKFAGEGVREYFMQLFSARPVICVSIQCYHYETRTRIVYYTDANGNSQSRVETYQERVDTYSESELFHYSSCRDVSNWSLMPDDSAQQITTIKLRKEVLMADTDTQEAYNTLQVDLVDRNRHRDVHIDCSTSQTLHNFKERIMVFDAKKGLPWWMNLNCFWLSTFFWCTWPFRWCMASVTKHDEFTFVKEISVHPNVLPQLTYPPMMTRGHVGPALNDEPAEVIHVIATAPPATALEGYRPLGFDPGTPVMAAVPPPYSAASGIPSVPPPAYSPPGFIPTQNIPMQHL